MNIKKTKKKLAYINELIEKLLLIVEYERFNWSQGYNYNKLLKELLIRKRALTTLSLKYKKVLETYNKKWIDKQIINKKKELELREYKARVIKIEEELQVLLNGNVL